MTLPEFVSISYSPTDGCETGSFESLSQWQDRVVREIFVVHDVDCAAGVAFNFWSTHISIFCLVVFCVKLTLHEPNTINMFTLSSPMLSHRRKPQKRNWRPTQNNLNECV